LGCSLFDCRPDPALDELTELAAALSGSDYAYIAGIDPSGIRFKSCFGFQADEQRLTSNAYQWMIETGQSLLIGDTGQDQRFSPGGILLPGGKPCLSYAAVPLGLAGQPVVGILAVLSQRSGHFSPEQIQLLKKLSRQAVTCLELYHRIWVQEQYLRFRRRSERLLAAERGYMHSTLDAIPSLVAVLDPNGRIVRINRACEQLTGLTAAEVAGRLFNERLMLSEDCEWVAQKIEEAAAGQTLGPFETTWQIASSAEEPGFATPVETEAAESGLPASANKALRVNWTLTPLRGPNREIQYLIVCGQDVTFQRHAEMALFFSEARYHELIENSLGFVFTCSVKGQLTSLNTLAAETLGYQSGELINRPVVDLIDPAEQAISREWQLAMETRGDWLGIMPLRCSNGRCRQIALRSRRMDLPGGEPFLFNHGIDVTGQYEAERALDRTTRQCEWILDSVSEGIFGIDLEGRFTFVNQAAAQALGCAPEQLIGRGIHEALCPGMTGGALFPCEADPILQAMRLQKTIRRPDAVFHRQDNTPIPVEYSASPLLDNGRISGMVIAFQNISERRRLDKMKDELLSTIGHELRTPLTSLRASLGLISSGALDRRPEKHSRMMEVAIGNCDRLTQLIDRILDFISLEKEKLQIDCQSVESSSLLHSAAAAVQEAAHRNQIHLHIEAISSKVRANERRIVQVLSELLDNAIKFSSPRTVISLRAYAFPPHIPHTSACPPQSANAECHRAKSPTEICFCIEDQGAGMAPENLESIFERFRQNDSSDSRTLGGVGLGLALCRKIVELHGGRIWGESWLGQGSRFFFTLPVAEQRS
jgi:PAS domain S-box-containing protein